MIKVMFQKNIYDSEGGIIEDCIILYMNDVFSLKLGDLNDLDDLIESLQRVRNEVLENYGE